MEEFDFYKDNYLLELRRKHDLDASIAIPIGIVSIIGSVIFVLLKDLKDFEKDAIFIWLVLSLGAAVISLVVTVVFLIKSYYNYEYIYVPTSFELKEYQDELISYHDGDTDKARIEFENYLVSEYAVNAHHNSINNDSKSAYLHNAKSFIIATLVSLLIGSIPYLFMFYDTEKTQKIEIVKPESYPRNNGGSYE